MALVVGRFLPAAWITNPISGLTNKISTVDGSRSTAAAQVVMNDLARVLLGTRRSDRVPTSILAEKSGLPTINELVIRGSAVAAWSAANGGPLECLLLAPDSRT